MFQRASTLVYALSSTPSWYSSGPTTTRTWYRPSRSRAARETQNRAVSSSISTPMLAMNASSPVAFQYSHVPQATSAEMWCSMRPERMGTCSPLGP